MIFEITILNHHIRLISSPTKLGQKQKFQNKDNKKTPDKQKKKKKNMNFFQRTQNYAIKQSKNKIYFDYKQQQIREQSIKIQTSKIP